MIKNKCIGALDLSPLKDEGGFYKSVYHSSTTIDINGCSRSIGSHIYYYLESDDFSAWHHVDCEACFDHDKNLQ